MKRPMFERFDQPATKVIKAAFAEAAMLGDDAVCTEHILLALATVDPVTSRLLTGAGGSPGDIRRVLTARGRLPNRRRDHQELLATLGVDLAEIRRRAEETFGAEAVTRAAWRVRRPRRRPLWSWISCSKPLPRRRCDSPLAGQPLALIPRVKRLLERASQAAGPQLASPSHLLLALVTGAEPASEILTVLGVDLTALAVATRREIDRHDASGERAS
ncbi:MAG TPA: Clp protease N-terminal domain-containing protein [Acidimicrobiia bacterium]|nr:Clp protease N-terminal domain-containing protein [Acidimicrobiia bacterium]